MLGMDRRARRVCAAALLAVIAIILPWAFQPFGLCLVAREAVPPARIPRLFSPPGSVRSTMSFLWQIYLEITEVTVEILMELDYL